MRLVGTTQYAIRPRDEQSRDAAKKLRVCAAMLAFFHFPYAVDSRSRYRSMANCTPIDSSLIFGCVVVNTIRPASPCDVSSRTIGRVPGGMVDFQRHLDERVFQFLGLADGDLQSPVDRPTSP